jgi:hypothetical protein
MTRNWFVPAAAVVLGVAVLSPAPSASAAPAPAFSGQQYGWDVPPQEFNEVQRRGFHDGVEAAHRDYASGKRPNVNEHGEYRDPNDLPRDVPPELRDAYRVAFRHGYGVAIPRFWSPEVVQQTWDWGMRGLENDAARNGFHEGTKRAIDDFQSHRRQDPDGHGEYRNPPVPPELVDEYRSGFMRGYEVAISQLSGEQAWQVQGDSDRGQAPDRFTESQRKGFHDGMEGAHKDRGNGRPPDPNNRDEYRHPQVPPEFAGEYREGFRRGYEMAAARLWGGM